MSLLNERVPVFQKREAVYWILLAVTVRLMLNLNCILLTFFKFLINCLDGVDQSLEVGINSIHDGGETGTELIQMKCNHLATGCSIRDV